MTSISGLGKDLFGAESVNAVRDALPRQDAISPDRVNGRSGDVAPGVGHRGPFDFEGVSDQSSLAHLDRSGDDPLDLVPDITLEDRDRARVLDSAGVDTVDDIGADDSFTVLEAVSGESAHGEPSSAERDQDDDGNSEFPQQRAHPDDGSEDWRFPRWAKVLISGLVAVFVAAMLFAVLQPVQVLPRIRLAPGYALADGSGAVVTSEDGRGTITLYTFAPVGCGDECEQVHSTMAEVARRVAADVDLAGTEFRTVTLLVGAESDDVARERSAVLDASGVWLAVDGPTAENVVGLGFGNPTDPASFSPAFAIVDGWGMIRGEYRYSTLANDADKLVRHIDVLGSELRNDHGFTSFVYEAAHAFQCYP